MLATVCLLTGCVTGSKEDPGGRPRRDFAATPQSLPPASDPSLSASASAPAGSSVPASASAPTAGASGSATATASTGPRSSAPAASAAPFHQVGSTTDRSGDAGSVTPGYADLAAITVEDDGKNARVTMRFAADVPARLPADETMGVGVDFYRSRVQIESDYQLFADGEPEGWFAYLQTPKGFVKYPGTFGLGGNRLVFTVPWSALGSPSEGGFSAFADWTRQAEPVNRAGEDFAPDIGNAAYSR